VKEKKAAQSVFAAETLGEWSGPKGCFCLPHNNAVNAVKER
jgi:hypothetical protein